MKFGYLAPCVLFFGLGTALHNADGQSERPQKAASRAEMPRYEHFAFCSAEGYLDGPSRQAMTATIEFARLGSADDEGNLFFTPQDGAIRVARINGFVETVAGADYYQKNLLQDEGPAAVLRVPYEAGVKAIGSPLKDTPEGRPAGYLLTSAGGRVWRVWRNPEKGGRWWAKAVGQTRFPGNPSIHTRRSRGKTEVIFYHDGNAWLWDEQKDEVRQILAAKDYMGHPVWKTINPGRPVTSPPRRIAPLNDGSFFLALYQESYPVGAVVWVSADGREAKLLCKNARGDVDKAWDGDTLTEAAFFGGPLLVAVVEPDIAPLTAVDDAMLRRFKDGRVSTLCKDGQWREFPTKRASNPRQGEEPYAECPNDKAPGWGRQFVVGPGGYFYQVYCMGGGDAWVWRVGPIDWAKPSVVTLEHKK